MAKSTLAALIMRQRNEQQTLTCLDTRVADLEDRAHQALGAGREDLAGDVQQSNARGGSRGEKAHSRRAFP